MEALSIVMWGVEELGVVGSGVPFGFGPHFSAPFSSEDPCELLIRLRLFPTPSGITRGFGCLHNAMSISSTKLILCSQIRVGETVVGRVNVAEMLYDIEPFSNCPTS